MSADLERSNEFYLAGFRYGEGYEILDSLQVGDTVDLIAEPGNPYDEHAVRVEHRRSRIGYVPRTCNQAVSGLLAQGGKARAEIAEVAPDRPGWEVIRVRVFGTTDGGEQPTTTSGGMPQ